MATLLLLMPYAAFNWPANVGIHFVGKPEADFNNGAGNQKHVAEFTEAVVVSLRQLGFFSVTALLLSMEMLPQCSFLDFDRTGSLTFSLQKMFYSLVNGQSMHGHRAQVFFHSSCCCRG